MTTKRRISWYVGYVYVCLPPTSFTSRNIKSVIKMIMPHFIPPETCLSLSLCFNPSPSPPLLPTHSPSFVLIRISSLILIHLFPTHYNRFSDHSSLSFHPCALPPLCFSSQVYKRFLWPMISCSSFCLIVPNDTVIQPFEWEAY